MPGTELGKAYVQIVPKAEGISSGIEDILGDPVEKEGKKAGGKLGGAISAGLKVAGAGIAAAAAGVASLVSAALSGYADYEQLVGGVETLFKDSADVVQEYAANAYKTAGLSANEYMETVTSFSASLLQSLGGDTAEAARISDMAITDMADNANKMGSDMSSIQAAYQGFAKQNYTMLDNLKLGYGGTKSEMERLLADAEAFSGVHYDIDNLNDVYEAIHVVQTELGITGTTALEASETISGSTAAMKAAWQNLLVGIADENADFDALVDGFTSSVSTVAANILPRISVALQGVGKLVEGLAPVIAEALPILIQDVLPPLLESAAMLLMTVVNVLIENLPMIIDVALQLIMALADGLVEALPVLIPAIVDVIIVIAEKLTDPETVTMLLDAVIRVAVALIEGLIATLPELMAGLAAIGENLWIILSDAMGPIIEWIEGIWDDVTKWFDENVIQPIAGFFTGLWEGIVNAFDTIIGPWLEIARRAFAIFDEKIIQPIKNAFTDLWHSVVSVATGAWESVKRVFSPVVEWFGRVFSGAWEAVKKVFSTGGRIFSGIKEGIEKAFKTVVNAIIEGINKVISVPFNAINSFLNTLRNVNILGVSPFGWIKTFGVPQIPKLAKGGIVDAPTLVEAGEGNSAEAIIPLDKLWREMRAMWSDAAYNGGRGLRSIGSMTVNVYPSDGMDEEKLAFRVMDLIQDAVDGKEAVFA